MIEQFHGGDDDSDIGTEEAEEAATTNRDDSDGQERAKPLERPWYNDDSLDASIIIISVNIHGF